MFLSGLFGCCGQSTPCGETEEATVNVRSDQADGEVMGQPLVEAMMSKEAVSPGVRGLSKVYTQEDATIPLVFGLPNGHSKTLLFTKRPMGLDFHSSAPLTVTKVKDQQSGHELGVLQDWILKAVDGHELGGSTFKEDFQLYCDAVQKLPLDFTKTSRR